MSDEPKEIMTDFPGGPLDALQIVCRDRDVWKRIASVWQRLAGELGAPAPRRRFGTRGGPMKPKSVIVTESTSKIEEAASELLRALVDHYLHVDRSGGLLPVLQEAYRAGVSVGWLQARGGLPMPVERVKKTDS